MKDLKEENKQILKIVIIGMLVYWLLNNLSIITNIFGNILNILSPFILGGVIAFILNIPMNFFERKFSKGKKKITGAKRFFAILLSIVIIILVIAVMVGLVIPQLVNVGSLLIEKMPYYIEKLKTFAENTLQNEDVKNTIQSIEIDTDALKNTILEGGKNIVTSSINAISGLVRGIANFVIGIVFAFYILLSKEKIKNFSKKIINAYFKENTVEYILNVSRLSSKTFRSFIVGQVTEACILGTLCAIGMLILRLPYAITIGILVGFTALIPIVGAFIGCIIGVLLIVAVDPIKAIIFVIFFLILQQIEGNVIYPKVVGNSVGLPGILVLVAVTVGGNLFGIMGMLIGLPVVSILYTILKDDVTHKLKKKEIAKKNI